MEREVLEKAIQGFNAERFPEAWTKLVKLESSGFKVEFGGTTCTACGFEEHFKDLEIYLKQTLKNEYKISKIERPKTDQYLVTYSFEEK